ncbi:MAG TPA: hypothetical protein VFP71_06600 [Candidatus Angelobacter sp.]|nr:hypothetical protein [Candidatus Angelobacter sp.]
MAGYLVNYTVQRPASAETATGLFTSNSVDATSRVWYQVPSNWPFPNWKAPHGAEYPVPVAADAPVANWTRKWIDNDPSINFNQNDDIYIRILPTDGFPPSKGNSPLKISFYACFGRPSGSGHGNATAATPFVLQANYGPGNNSPRTTFGSPITTPTAPTDGSSIYYLGKLARSSGVAPASYSFIIGAYLVYEYVEGWTFGHDPKIIVNGGGGPE